jgi:hypothetical protein
MIENEVKADEILSEAEKDENTKKKLKSNLRKDEFKTKECPVISYNKHSNTLDIMFDKYGIRIKNVKDFIGNIVNVKYKGEIGKPNFEIAL